MSMFCSNGEEGRRRRRHGAKVLPCLDSAAHRLLWWYLVPCGFAHPLIPIRARVADLGVVEVHHELPCFAVLSYPRRAVPRPQVVLDQAELSGQQAALALDAAQHAAASGAAAGGSAPGLGALLEDALSLARAHGVDLWDVRMAFASALVAAAPAVTAEVGRLGRERELGRR